MESGSERRFVGGAKPLRDAGRYPASEDEQRWWSDPIWQNTGVPPEVTSVDAVAVGDWPLGEVRAHARRGRPSHVQDDVPERYDAYLRILYPFVGPEVIENGETVGHQLITWHETALANGRTPHRRMHAAGIGPDPSDTHGGHLPYQDLGPDQAHELYEILRRHTRRESGWFLLWDGDYHGGLVLPESSKVRDGFDMSWYAFRGPLWAWRGFWSPPRWWWPDDRAWCYQTSIDSDLTNCAFLGASSACVEEILDNQHIEAVIAYADDPILGGTP